MKKIKLFAPLLAPLAIIPTVAVAISCQKNTDTNGNAGNQENVLKDTLTKNQILTTITNTYLSSFYQSEFQLLDENSKKSDPILALLNLNNSELYKTAWNIFQFYAANKLQENSQFFWNLKSAYINANIDTSTFNPAPFTIPSESDFRFMLQNSNLISNNIRLDIQKLLLAQIYLLKNRDDYRALANNDKGQDKYQLSLASKMNDKDTPYLQKDIYASLDLADNSLYLIKYLIDNPLLESWSFTDNREMNLRWGKANISTFEQFNSLASYNPSGRPQYELNPKATYPEQLIATGASEGEHVLENLLAYKGLIKNSYTSGLLSGSLYGIQANLASVFGFVDPSNNRVYSQDSFKFAAILAAAQNQPKASASASLITKATESKLASFSASDIDFDGLTRDAQNASLFTKQLEVNGHSYDLQFEQKGIISFDGQILTIPMRLSVKQLSANNYYDFNAKLNYDNKTKTFSTPSEDIAYNLDKYAKDVDMIKDNQINAQYVVKIAPLYQNKKVLDATGNEVTKKVLAFDNTPWESYEQKQIIANNIIVQNADAIFREAVSYFKELGFEFDTTKMNKSVLDMLKLEGLI
ncbi:HinT-interacting membrane complex lipoprotein P60 [Metamycoplasma neophronis]|uniref:P60-like lipoprotein n=1 Tax=Metamycoplasma neophronis TaxID=872983 RepID=A0ABY2Z180_9BACT|nr:hypothetical protein [Metamycoplasma neophronis]TPR54674.1 hypothetical protein FJR74_00160 [Metamycoplasma neophronis]